MQSRSAEHAEQQHRHAAALAAQRAILEATLENIDQGITMVDADLHTIVLNNRFLELLELPAERFARGFHMEDAFRFNAERGDYGPGDIDEQVRQRVKLARRFEPHSFERTRPDGRVLAVRGNPLSGGGFVSTYAEVTEQRHAEAALREQVVQTQEALEQQTATAEILRVISKSPTDVTPVFQAIAERAMVLAGADVCGSIRFDGERMHMLGWHGTSHEAEAAIRASFPRPPDPSSAHGRCILAGTPVQVADVWLDPEYRLNAAATANDYRSLLAVPMRQGGKSIGSIAVGRLAPGRFPDKVMALLQTFADQAVIAVQNVRLFNETRESLQQQKASAEVLAVISSSVADTQPVFEKILDSCRHLFGGDELDVLLVDEQGQLRIAAYQGQGVRHRRRDFPGAGGAHPRRARTARAPGGALAGPGGR